MSAGRASSATMPTLLRRPNQGKYYLYLGLIVILPAAALLFSRPAALQLRAAAVAAPGEPPWLPPHYAPLGAATCPARGRPLPVTRASLTSQSGQDGIISSIFAALNTTNRYYAEFGFNSPDWLGASGANTYQLALAGWRGLLLDGGNENASINLRRHWLTPANIVPIFDGAGVPRALDYLSVDVDSVDLWMLRALLVAGYRPRLVSIEYNVNYALHSCVTQGWWATQRRVQRVYGNPNTYGTSLRAISRLAAEFRYALVYVENGFDAFLVPCELLAAHGFSAPTLESFQRFTCRAEHAPVEPAERSAALADLMDYCVWAQTGDRAAAVAAAAEEVLVRQRQSGCPAMFYE